MSPILSIIRC